jgi:hypothetical protein
VSVATDAPTDAKKLANSTILQSSVDERLSALHSSGKPQASATAGPQGGETSKRSVVDPTWQRSVPSLGLVRAFEASRNEALWCVPSDAV